MSIVHTIAAFEPVGLMAYSATMAFFLGGLALATHRDRVRERECSERPCKLATRQ
jgi:hypothetical protein